MNVEIMNVENNVDGVAGWDFDQRTITISRSIFTDLQTKSLILIHFYI